MKTYKYLLLLSLPLLFTASAVSQSTAVKDAKATFDKALAEFNAGDYDTYLTVIADDFEGYTGVYTPLRFEGKAAWTKFIKGLTGYASATYDQRQPDYRNYGEHTVLCNAYFVFTTVTKDGVVETQTGRETTVMRKINGEWKVVNYHFSAMF